MTFLKQSDFIDGYTR